MTKRNLLVLGVVGVLATFAAAYLLHGAGPQPLRVGVLVPLTGGAASYGENARKGAELAFKIFEARHPDTELKLIVEDSRGEAAVGVRAASKLIDVDGVKAIVGCVTSGVTLAVAPLANEHRVPIVSPGASSPNITKAGEFVFRTWPSDVFEAEAMAGYVGHRPYRKLAVLRVNNEYGAAMETALRTQLREKAPSATIVISESFEQGARDMRPQLLHLRDAGPDAIYFIGFPEAAVVFARAYAESGMHTDILATSAFEDPQIPKESGGALDGTVYAKPLSTSPRQTEFRASYHARYGQDPGVVADTAFDATMLVLEAIASARKGGREVTGDEIHDYLMQVRGYAGASGVLSFDADGDVAKPVGLFVLKNGAYTALGQ